MVDLLAAAATSVGAVSTEEVSVVVSAAVVLMLVVFVAAVWLSNPLAAEPGAAVVALALAVPVLAAFVQPRICLGALILPVEVSADQPVRSDTTTEAPARLLLGHTNPADGETNRRDRMSAETQPLFVSRIARLHQQGKT